VFAIVLLIVVIAASHQQKSAHSSAQAKRAPNLWRETVLSRTSRLLGFERMKQSSSS
jgi:hypothetical protein